MKKLLTLLALLSAACNTDFTQPYEVDEPKIMGVRVEVAGDPERAWPEVGESFTMRVLVARSNKPTTLPLEQQLDGAVSVCIGGKLPDSSLFCIAELPMSALQGTAKNRVVSFEELEIPLSFGSADPRALGGSPNVLIFGGVCVEGKVERVKDKVAGEAPANELFRCVDNAKAELKDALTFTSTVAVDYPDDAFEASLNPSFACDETDENSICTTGTIHKGEETRGGSIVLVRPRRTGAADNIKHKVIEWPEVIDNREKLAVKGCAKDPRFSSLKVKAGAKEHLIRIRFDQSDREMYQVQEMKLNKTIISTKREELLVSHAATFGGGELARYFSVIPRDASAKEAEVELAYTPPDQSEDAEKRITAAGRLVRFYFVVRDQRGGVDLTTRSLCLIP